MQASRRVARHKCSKRRLLFQCRVTVRDGAINDQSESAWVNCPEMVAGEGTSAASDSDLAEHFELMCMQLVKSVFSVILPSLCESNHVEHSPLRRYPRLSGGTKIG